VDTEIDRLKQEVVDAAKQLDRLGLVWHSSGNVSARLGDQVLITASGIPYDRLDVDGIAVVDLQGNQVEGTAKASIEIAMHLAVYAARPDAGAVAHTHPILASAFAAARKPIPAYLDENDTYFGGPVEVTRYAVSGSPDLAAAAAEALGERAAVLLANHGVLACGKDLEEAVHVSGLVERAADGYLACMALGGVAERPAEAEAFFRQVYRYRHGMA